MTLSKIDFFPLTCLKHVRLVFFMSLIYSQFYINVVE